MPFDWDPSKNDANLNKHGISFDEARNIFDGPILTRVDDRQDYGENRSISLGALSRDVVLVVIHTERGDTIRLISARKANRRERKVYDDHLGQAEKGDRSH
jgi:uncharacterized DUF497 family protein